MVLVISGKHDRRACCVFLCGRFVQEHSSVVSFLCYRRQLENTTAAAAAAATTTTTNTTTTTTTITTATK